MEKTKMGITVGLLGAAIYFMGIINIVPLILLAGYVLLMEKNEWLRRCAVKATVLYVSFALLTGIISAVINPVDSLLGMAFHFYGLSSYSGLIVDIIVLARFVLFASLGIHALTQGSVPTQKTDALINQHM